VLCYSDLRCVDCPAKGPKWTKISAQGYHDDERSRNIVDPQRLRQKSETQRLPGSPDLVLIATDMGDDVVADTMPVVCHHAKETGAEVVVFAAIPHASDATERWEAAMTGLGRLRTLADNVVIIEKECLLQHRRGAREPVPFSSHFTLSTDEVLRQGIQSLCETIFLLGEVNVAVAVVKKVMSLPGMAVMAMGEGAGSLPALEAAHEALANPSAQVCMEDARGVLVNFRGGTDLTLWDVQEAAELIVAGSHPGCIFAFGVSAILERLYGGAEATVIATGIDSNLPLPPQPRERTSR
jgi:cell division protein FtsZ